MPHRPMRLFVATLLLSAAALAAHAQKAFTPDGLFYVELGGDYSLIPEDQYDAFGLDALEEADEFTAFKSGDKQPYMVVLAQLAPDESGDFSCEAIGAMVPQFELFTSLEALQEAMGPEALDGGVFAPVGGQPGIFMVGEDEAAAEDFGLYDEGELYVIHAAFWCSGAQAAYSYSLIMLGPASRREAALKEMARIRESLRAE